MSLVVWLPLNGNLENQGLSNVTITNNGATVDNNGKIGKCYSFSNGNTLFCADTILSKSQNEYSISVWAKGYGCLYSQRPEMNSIYRCIFIYSQNRILFDEGNRWDASVTYDGNNWNHFVFIKNGSKRYIYINGYLAGENTNASTPSQISTGFFIGDSQNTATSTTGNPFNGKMNDFRIYDHALSAKEVGELAKGLVLHYRLAGPGQENLISNTSNKIQSTNVTTNYNVLYSISGSQMEKGAKYVYSGYFENTGTKIIKLRVQWYNSGSDRGGPISSININPGDKGFYYLPFTYPSGTYSTLQLGMDGNSNTAITSSTYNYAFVKLEHGSVQTPWCPNPADQLYSAMGYNNNIEYDCSGYRRNGIKSGTITWDIDSPRYTTSYKFNGSSCIKNNQFCFNSNIWTVSLWYKYNTAPTAYEGFICLSKNDGSDSNKKIAIMPNSNYIWFKAENTSITMSSLKVNEWCHLAMVSNGTSVIIYENGIQKGTTTMSSSVTGAYDLVVGARASSAGAATTSVYNKGNISDVRIYSTALSAEDIAELYHSAVIVDNTGKSYAYEYFEAQ